MSAVGSPSSNSISNSSSLADGDGLDDGGIAGLRGRGCGWGGGDRLAERRDRRVTAPTVSSSPGFRTCWPRTRLPLTNVPLELPRSWTVSRPSSSKSSQCRRLTCDDLIRMMAVVVAAEAGDAVGQLERRRGAAAPDDLEYIIHRD